MEWLGIIITGVLGIGVVSVWAKKIINVLSEVKDLLVAVVDASTDGTITTEEIQRIIKEAKDIPAAISNLLKRNKAK